jgi:anti-sigma-K factor RskA
MSIDLHHLIAPYALDALEADDRSRFEAHLALCEQCRVELVGFLSTAARLGEAEAVTPPPALRERLLAIAASTPQERPVVTALAQRSRMRRLAPRISLAAAAAVAVVGIGGFVAEHERADDLSADRSRLTTVMTARDATTTEGAVAGGGEVRVIASPAHDAAVVVGSSLDELGDDETYQVWRMHDGKPTSVGLLGRGPGLLYVDGITDADAFAVSVEPAGGSPQPTSDPIVSTPV